MPPAVATTTRWHAAGACAQVWGSRRAGLKLRYSNAFNQETHTKHTTYVAFLLQSLDAATMGKLGSQAKRHGEVLQAAGPPPSQGGGSSSRRRRPEQQPGALLPCVLPKAAMDRAAHLLLLEADLRGHPELRRLLGNSSGLTNGQQGDMQQHARIVMVSGNGSGEERQQHRRRPQGRSLGGEERLVLGILSDPRFGFAAKTELP